MDLLLLSLDKRTKIYNAVIKDKKSNHIILKYLKLPITSAPGNSYFFQSP